MGDVRIRGWGAAGDLGWVVMAHGELYAAEYGWHQGFERHVLQAVAAIAEPAASSFSMVGPIIRIARTQAASAQSPPKVKPMPVPLLSHA